MDEHNCFDKLAEHWQGPIEKPVSFNRETGEMSVSWALRVFNYTKSGGISSKGGSYLTLNYCFICGKKLVEDKNENSDQTGP